MIPGVRDWVESQGYSLEMRAASAFRSAGFESVRQSSYYSDPETSKPREMDVEVICRSTSGFVDIRFFVECKSGNKPWVLFSSPDTLVNYNRLFAFCAMSKQARKFFAQFEHFPELFKRFAWLKKDGVIGGYSLRQAFSKDVDPAYTAAMNVVKICNNLVTGSETSIANFKFAFPVIVVDQPLIRCMLEPSGEIKLTEVEEGEFLFTAHELGTCIRIVTITHLVKFAEEAKRVEEQLREELRSEEERILATLLESHITRE